MLQRKSAVLERAPGGGGSRASGAGEGGLPRRRARASRSPARREGQGLLRGKAVYGRK